MEGMSSLEPLEQSVLNTLLFARPMEGITETDPERSALVSLLDNGQSNLELPAQPMLDITQDEMTDMDTDQSERSALATHLDYGLLNLESLSRPMVDVALDRLGGDICSTSGRVFGPRDGPRQWTHGTFI